MKDSMKSNLFSEKQTIDRLSLIMLENHVSFELNMFRKGSRKNAISEFISQLYSALENISLNDFFHKDKVIDVINHEVVELEIPGGIIELVGELTKELHQSNLFRLTIVNELMNQKQFLEYVDKVLSLKAVKKRLFDSLFIHPAFIQFISAIIGNITLEQIEKIKDGLDFIPIRTILNEFFTDKNQSEHSCLKKRIYHLLDIRIERILVHAQVKISKAITEDLLRKTALDIWDEIEHRTISDISLGFSELDQDEFMVLGYEFWLSIRKSDHFKNCCRVIVGGFYNKYGNHSVASLLSDIEVDSVMLSDLFSDLIIPTSDALLKNGFIENTIRKRLTKFYQSTEYQDSLKQALESSEIF